MRIEQERRKIFVVNIIICFIITTTTTTTQNLKEKNISKITIITKKYCVNLIRNTN
jgi:hypothetical protein